MHQPRTNHDSPSFRLKSQLISLATFGYGNQVVARDEDAIAIFEDFVDVLRRVLPRRLGFNRLAIRMPEVVLECTSGDFSLDAASGGVAAVIDVAWQLYLKSTLTNNFVAVFDEPENHLHPEMQREFMPGLLKAFPEVQFIVATHNPFVVTSVEDSEVVILDYDNDRVVSRRLSEIDRTGSANQVLTDVLGLPAPIPLWVEERFDSIIRDFSALELTEETIVQLKRTLDQQGLSRAFAEVLTSLEGHRTGGPKL